MSNPFEHPSLRLRVTEEQRDRALAYLQDAYADGRLDEIDFDDRMGQALAARTRRELNTAFTGLARIPISSAAVTPARVVHERGGDVMASLVHFSPLVTWILGPMVTFMVAEKGTRLRAEAAKSLNFNMLMTALVVATPLMPFEWMIPVWILLVASSWFLLTIVNGARVLTGGQANYPLSMLRVFPTGEKKRRRQLGR